VLLAAAAGLIGAFFAIEARSPAPLLPLRIFRLRTLSGSNFGGLMLGGSVFAEFFLLTLYMQQVLHYSALKTGVAYISLTLTIIVFSGVAQALVNRVGVRWVLPAGLALSTAALVLFANSGARPVLQRPVSGFMITASDSRSRSCRCDRPLAACALPMPGGLGPDQHHPTGRRRDRVAVATTVATTVTAHFVTAHAGSSALGGAALTHGFQAAFYVWLASQAPARCSQRCCSNGGRPRSGRSRWPTERCPSSKPPDPSTQTDVLVQRGRRSRCTCRVARLRAVAACAATTSSRWRPLADRTASPATSLVA